jgi:hypothetical protein
MRVFLVTSSLAESAAAVVLEELPEKSSSPVACRFCR